MVLGILRDKMIESNHPVLSCPTNRLRSNCCCSSFLNATKRMTNHCHHYRNQNLVLRPNAHLPDVEDQAALAVMAEDQPVRLGIQLEPQSQDHLHEERPSMACQ